MEVGPSRWSDSARVAVYLFKEAKEINPGPVDFRVKQDQLHLDSQASGV